MSLQPRERWRRRLAFLFSGGCGFLIYTAVSLLLVRIPGVATELAAFAAVAVSVPPAFLLQRNFAFRDKGSAPSSFGQYCLLQLVNAVCISAMTRLGRGIGLADEVNLVLSAAVVIVLSYLVLSRVVFTTASKPDLNESRTINAQYNTATAGGLTDRISTMMRRKMYARFARGIGEHENVLDVGVTSDREQLASNYLEAWHPWKDRITACGIDDASFLEEAYPGMRFVQADGKDLPFESGSFEWVHSSAVLEHVGSRQEQARFVAELHRVCSRGIYLTTPNRWFPVEFHSVWPLAHWLPMAWFRRLLRMAGHRELALEANLNLLGRRDLDEVCRMAGLQDWEISSVSLCGWPSNLILTARKSNAA